jgi:hypothetical protein
VRGVVRRSKGRAWGWGSCPTTPPALPASYARKIWAASRSAWMETGMCTVPETTTGTVPGTTPVALVGRMKGTVRRETTVAVLESSVQQILYKEYLNCVLVI